MSKARKRKLRRQSKERDKKADVSTRLHAYLENFGAPEGVQDPSEATIDSQIKGLTLTLAGLIAETDYGTIIDVGCGRGILLRRLNDISGFKNKKRWSYCGTDNEEHKDDIIAFAYDASIHRRVDFVPLGRFYESWPSGEDFPRPHIVIICNVLHELSIEATTQIFHHLSANITPHDTLYIQDLQVFPKAERGSVCWQPIYLEQCLKISGFATFSVEESSRTGNRWFNIGAKRADLASPSIEQVRIAVISGRKRQWEHWQALGALHVDDEKFRDVVLAKIDFDLQFGSLSIQLQDVGTTGVQKFTQQQEVLLFREVFQKQLQAFDPDAFTKQPYRVDTLGYFRDRANNQDSLERFLREQSAIAVIRGGPLTGKTALVKEVLSRRALQRHAIFLDVQPEASVWNIVNELLSKLGSRVSDEIARGFRRVTFRDIEEQLKTFIDRVAPKTVIIFEHFERLVGPNGTIGDPEVRGILGHFAHAPSAKLIITSRQYDIDLSFIDAGVMSQIEQPIVGRFPRGEHVVNVLDDFIDRPHDGIGDYPKELLEAIDRHPYLTYLAALIIRQEGKECLLDAKLLRQLREKLRTELFERVVDDASRPAIEAMSLLRIPAPRSMIEALAGKESVEAAVKTGLVYPVSDFSHSDLISVIGALGIRTPAEDLDIEAMDDKDVP